MTAKIVCIDFDGTIVEHIFPKIGNPVPLALESIKELQENGFKIILWTMRSGNTLDEAVQFLKDNDIELWGVNENPDQSWSSSPKAYAPWYIDDAAIGCPLMKGGGDKPYVDWYKIMPHLRPHYDT